MSPILGIIASANQQGRGGGPESGYDSLATVTVPSGGLATITFAGIPSGYKHLQIRGIGRTSAGGESLRLRYNSDTGANYANHELYGTGSAANAYGEFNVNSNFADSFAPSSASANVFGVGVIDILDYANTNKYKTLRALSGYDNNGSGYAILNSGVWRNTAAINTIVLFFGSGNLVQYSTFALYGVK
jgi:hypothetical protein